jgi:uncharacterized cupredoxin-like copper-binding protein
MVLATLAFPVAEAIDLLPSAPAVGIAHPAPGNSSVTVNMTDAPRFVPRSLVGNASSTVSVHLFNQGRYNHTFTLSKVPNAVLSPSWTPAELSAFFARNGSLANVSLAPGQEGWANISLNASTGGDSFEFVSLVPYQFQAGMWGFLNVTVSGVSLLLSENTTDHYQFIPDELGASPAHYPVKLDVLVTNTGSLGHTFTVAPQTNVTLSPTNFTQYFTAHPALVSATVPSGAGSTVWANFTVPTPGVYEYICEITGHFSNGMFGFLYVGIPVPPPPVPPSTALIETWVLAGSGVLLAIGIAIAVIASFAGRFPRSPGSRGGHH